MIGAIVSLVVCLAAAPDRCETVLPDYQHVDGSSVTFFECLGASGQSIAQRWVSEHPDYVLRRVQCSMASDAAKLRAQLAQPEA